MPATSIDRSPRRPPAASGQRWLVFIHQLPARPSNARVKTWRRLQQLGAVPVKHAVHVLPSSAQAREDFEWLRSEVIGLGGQASIFEASSMTGLEEQQMVSHFREATTRDFLTLNKDIEVMRTHQFRESARGDADARRAVRGLRERYEQVRARDFFSAPGHEEAQAALAGLGAAANRPSKRKAPAPAPTLDVREYQHRTWVTRPRPGVDRFSSAWLIQRFIDPGARFTFATSPERAPDAIPFDMYQEGGFRHEGDRCTFEVLQERFGATDPGVRRIAEIVHDLDLKDDHFRSPHAPTIGSLVEGLRATIPEDGQLLAQGIALFEALYASFQTTRPARGGRPKIC